MRKPRCMFVCLYGCILVFPSICGFACSYMCIFVEELADARALMLCLGLCMCAYSIVITTSNE